MNGIPVLIHLPGPEFMALDRIASKRNTTMRKLIEAQTIRALTDHIPHPTSSPSTGRTRAHVKLTTEQQAELRMLITDRHFTYQMLADRYGCSTATIGNWRRRFEADA